MHTFSRFQACFKRSLKDFWIDNVRGLDVEKFDREVVKRSRCSLLVAIKMQWGKEGAAIFKRLIPKANNHKKLTVKT